MKLVYEEPKEVLEIYIEPILSAPPVPPVDMRGTIVKEMGTEEMVYGKDTYFEGLRETTVKLEKVHVRVQARDSVLLEEECRIPAVTSTENLCH